MKFNIFTIAAAAVLSMGTAACSLDKEVDLTQQAANVFNDYDMTRGFQARLYDYLPDAFAPYNSGDLKNASPDCMTDNAVGFWSGLYYNSVVTDALPANTSNLYPDYWTRNYNGIRGCNQFLTNAKPNVVGNADKRGDDNHLYDRWVAETRVLRAILHFDLIHWYGDCSIVGDNEEGVPVILDPSSPMPERTPAADALKWVADECDKYKDDLPFRYSNEEENWGRINGAAAYALKARALLYRASPLYNKENNSSYWAEAVQACREFFSKNQQQSNPYRLYTTPDNDPNKNYYQCFVDNPVLNNEYILSRSVWTTRTIEDCLAPVGFQGKASSYSRTNPTQNLVDAYETKNGLPIDKDPTFNEQKPFDNRDPRLEQTIFHHGQTWGDAQTNEERQLDMRTGGVDLEVNNGGTCTGYYCKKYVNNISWSNPSDNRHACPIFRYAEMLLNMAEALNESGSASEALTYVNQVRARVGMPALTTTNQSELRERIQNERRIELCFEDHRFFDERRWKLFEGKTASSEASEPRYKQVYTRYGYTVTQDEGQDPVFSYGPATRFPNRVFNAPKNYFFPIPHDEHLRTGLPQNPGWEL